MENKTLFFILGIGLVALALIVSAIGLRFEKFPGSRLVQLGVVALFAAVVVGTAAFAWLEAEDEQQHQHEEALAEAAESNEAGGDEAEAQEEVGPGVATTTTTAAASAAGAQVFDENGCGGCHTLAAAGSTGQIGPDLDGALKGKTEEFIHTSIVDPNAEIATSYSPGVMPENFGSDLSSDELDALVQYLAESTGAKGGG
ncbi:MAG: c-type cytochrome [Solirubrobacterales bacterium]|nr:c-type cytochrome [Solirubrobacterales bacterium]